MVKYVKCPTCKGSGKDHENTVDIIDHLGEVLGMRHPDCEICDGDGFLEDFLAEEGDDPICLEAESKEKLQVSIIHHENTGWILLREWEDKGTYCALMEEVP